MLIIFYIKVYTICQRKLIEKLYNKISTGKNITKLNIMF